MPQSNIEALAALGSFLAALLVVNLTIRTQKGELPGGALAVLFLRTFLGFLLTAAIVLGYRSLIPR